MIALFLTSTAILGAAANSQSLLNEAATAYQAGLASRDDSVVASGHFRRSADAYESLWTQGERTPQVARNLAQARLLSGDLGRSIRDYRRGLRLNPHDAELRRGLAFAREQVAYPLVGDLEKAARPRQVDSTVDRLGVSADRVGLMAVIVASAGWFFLARAWMTRRGGLGAIGGICVGSAALVGGWLLWEDSRLRDQQAPAAAVIVAPTDLRFGNNEEYSRRIDARLPAGIEVRVLGERGGWLHVELADGTAGWIPRERAAVVD